MKERLRDGLTEKNSIAGYHIADLIGIILMLFPLYLVLKDFDPVKTSLFGILPWFPKKVSLKPHMITALFAIIFYIPLLLRYDMFRVNGVFDIFVTIIRSFLDCMVIAGLLTIIIPDSGAAVPPLVIVGILFSWLGMRTIAGYSWILFIICAWGNLSATSEAMGTVGAPFIIFTALSFLLQLCTYTDLRELVNDFGGTFAKSASYMKDDINLAAQDATQKADQLAELITKKKIPSSETRKLQSEISGSGIQVNLKALDVNNDGVIDEKDFAILSNHKDHDKE